MGGSRSAGLCCTGNTFSIFLPVHSFQSLHKIRTFPESCCFCCFVLVAVCSRSYGANKVRGPAGESSVVLQVPLALRIPLDHRRTATTARYRVCRPVGRPTERVQRLQHARESNANCNYVSTAGGRDRDAPASSSAPSSVVPPMTCICIH